MTAAKHRIIGIDIARGLALLGMFNVHIELAGPEGQAPDRAVTAVLEASSGRASVLFFLLSGISLSVISKRGSASASEDVLHRRGWILVLLGLLIAGSFWGASILEHYGIMFLLAPFLLRRSNRTLVGLTVAGLIVGPVALLGLRPLTDDIGSYTGGVLEWLMDVGWDLAVSGNFPLVVWFGFFAFGVRLGRLDLGSTQVATRLLGIGLGAMLALWLLLSVGGLAYSNDFDDLGGPAHAVTGLPGNTVVVEDFVLDTNPAQLLSTDSQSNQIGWTIESAALSALVLGACLLLPASFVRVLTPLAALGSISLTAYLIHIFFVVDAWFAFVPIGSAQSLNQRIGVLFALEATLVLLCWWIVHRWQTGPAERALKFLASR